MYVCVCVCIYMYIYICVCIYIYIYTHTHTHTECPKVKVIPAQSNSRCNFELEMACTCDQYAEVTELWWSAILLFTFYYFCLTWIKNVIEWKYSVTHGNLTSFEWVVLRTAPKKNKLCQCVVSTRWCHSAQCKRVNDHCSKHVSRAPHFPFRRRAVAPSFSRSFNVWFFFFGGIWNSVFTLTNPVR